MNNNLLTLLRKGGYILYSRHGEANVGEDLPDMDLRDCNTQRNLSELGRRQAIYYGEIISALRIPVYYPVEASPFCRAIETAGLAFGWMNVSVDSFWVNIYNLNFNISTSEQERILKALQLKLEMSIPIGVNRVIISHNFPDRVGLRQIPDMGTVVIRPLGRDNGYEVIETLSLYDMSVMTR